MYASVLSALSTVFPNPSNSKKIPIILISHDRGARITHRLAVDYSHPTPEVPTILSQFSLLGICLMDIMPTTAQWEASALVPGAAAGYFHWPFLARPDMAVPMITAYGGDRFCRDLLTKSHGKNEAGAASFFAGGSEEVYAANFAKEEAIKGACEDYVDGATGEVKMQSEDQKAGRKIETATLVLWSLAGIGRWGDVGRIWEKEWIKEGIKVEGFGVGEGVGHYLAEEAPEVVGVKVAEWLGSLGVKME
jgi:pimeloyl-ACP methyl ester carboxylesterase